MMTKVDFPIVLFSIV